MKLLGEVMRNIGFNKEAIVFVLFLYDSGGCGSSPKS
jgi:hypothetical protein